jgi:hypothetical protein
LIIISARRFVIGYWATTFYLKVRFCGRMQGVTLVQSAVHKEKTMRTTILKVIGVALVVSSTFQMASAAEHHGRRNRAPAVAQEQIRNSNAYFAAQNDYAARSNGWRSDRGEAAISGAIAGH